MISKKKKITKKSPNQYVDNKKFLQVIKDYKLACRKADSEGRERPSIPDYAGECILKIATNLKNHRRFIMYSYKDEMASDAIVNCILYFDRFDENRFSNPHAYYTMVCWQAFIHRINGERKERYVLYKSFEREMIMSGDSERIRSESEGLLTEEMYDNIASYIEDFEKSEKEKKQKRTDKLREKKVKDSLELFFVDDEKGK